VEIKQSHYKISPFVPTIAIKTHSIDEAITREVELPTLRVCARYNIIQNHTNYYTEIKKELQLLQHQYNSITAPQSKLLEYNRLL